MTHQTEYKVPPIRTDKKTDLMYRVWEASPGPADLVFIMVHGLGAYGGRWAPLAGFLQARDSAVSMYAIELRGFGETKTLKGHVESFNVYFRDIRRLRKIVKLEHPAAKVILMGSSMGGLIAFVTAALFPDMFDGLICISPAFTSRLKFKFTDYFKIFVEALFNPKRQFRMPFRSNMCTRDRKYSRRLAANHREHRLATSRLLFDIAIAQVQARLFKRRITAHTLFLVAEHDELVDPVSSKKTFAQLKAEDKTLISYPAMYHGLEIDIGKEAVFTDILKWTRTRWSRRK